MYRILVNKVFDLLEDSYQLNYPNYNQDSWFKCFEKFKLFLTHSYEVVSTIAGLMPEDEKNKLFSGNKAIIQKEFEDINKSNKNTDQKNAAYFVSSYDHNGAFLGTAAMLNHFHEIKILQEHGYVVYPHVVDNFYQISYHVRDADLVVINAHGSPYFIQIDYFTVESNLTFHGLREGADIVLNSCSTGAGLRSSIASKIAEDNINSNVFGALEIVWAMNINFSTRENETFVKNVEYQPGMSVQDILLPLPSVEFMHKFNYNIETSSCSDCINEDLLIGDIAFEEVLV
jgi:hypothetical protein